MMNAFAFLTAGGFDVNDAPDDFSLGWGDWADPSSRGLIDEARISRCAGTAELAMYELGVLVAGGTLDHLDIPLPPFVDLPTPNDRFDGRIVIASVWGRDGFIESERGMYPGEPEFLGTLLLLNPTSPFYTVAQIKSQHGYEPWSITTSEDHPNINPAVTDGYAQWGGDY